jgi:hypothetical protein
MIKKILYIITLFFVSFSFSQITIQTNNVNKVEKTIHLEGGFNVSIPIHIMMFRTHRLAIGGNLRA